MMRRIIYGSRTARPSHGVAATLDIVTVQTRFSATCYIRYPTAGSIPTHSPIDEQPLDADLVLSQLKGAALAIMGTRLTQNVTHMDPQSYFECCVQDTMVCGQNVSIMMPKIGMEHRSAEMSETVRYLRSQGGMHQDPLPFLQDDPGVKARATDFLSLPSGFMYAYGSSRTNKRAHEVLQAAYEKQFGKGGMLADGFETVEDAPPLQETIGFAGDYKMIMRDEPQGHLAAEAFPEGFQHGTPLTWLRIPAGTQFCTWHVPQDDVREVLVEDEADEAMDIMARAGLSPVPVEWGECRRAGINLRSFFLVVEVGKGGGHMHANANQQDMYHLHNRKKSRDRKPFVKPEKGKEWQQNVEQRNEYHVEGLRNLALQMSDGSMPQAVFQPKPRFNPRLHREAPRDKLEGETEESSYTPGTRTQRRAPRLDMPEKERPPRPGMAPEELWKTRRSSEDNPLSEPSWNRGSPDPFSQ